MPVARKRFAQHWLKDQQVHRAIVAASGLQELAASDPLDPKDPVTVLEIGPGTGALTHHLLKTGAQVIGVELDRDLCQILRKTFGGNPQFELIEGDFLRSPLPAKPTHVVANIPYNITSPILEKLLGSPEHPLQQFDRIVLLVQRELAERITALPGDKAYGAMSIRIQYLAATEIIRIVPPKAFQPPPQVDSAVIRLQPRSWPVLPQDLRWFSVLVQQGFSTRRKTLANTLQSLVNKATVIQILQAQGWDDRIRAEGLSISQWIQLSDLLLPHRIAEGMKGVDLPLD